MYIYIYIYFSKITLMDEMLKFSITVKISRCIQFKIYFIDLATFGIVQVIIWQQSIKHYLSILQASTIPNFIQLTLVTS